MQFFFAGWYTKILVESNKPTIFFYTFGALLSVPVALSGFFRKVLGVRW